MPGQEALTDSLALLAGRAGDVTETVYARLFAQHPELEALFSMDTDGGVRGSMLAQAFDCLMDLAEGTGTLAETVIRSERINHDTYDVPPGMFEIFFDIIRDVTRDTAGADWTSEMEQGWDEVLAKASRLASHQAA